MCLGLTVDLILSLRLLRGSSKFRWLGRLVKLLSNFNLNLSVSWKSLASPRERLKVPGPTSDPTAALPKRPITFALEQVSVSVDQVLSGGAAGAGEYVRVPPLVAGVVKIVGIARKVRPVKAPKLAFPEESNCRKGVS